MCFTRAANLKPGMVLDIDPEAPYVTETNRPNVEFEYVVVEAVNGGWADGAARNGEVLVYSAQSLAVPLLIPEDTVLTVVETRVDF